MIQSVFKIVSEKLFQYILSIAGGFFIAMETSVLFFLPCLIITGFDVYSAYCLGRRVHKKYPEKSDGKFKSEYKFRIMYTMIVIFLLLVLANYIDIYIIKNTDSAVRFALAMFFVYQGVSILENWSSENDNKFAKVLQNILVDKAERHFNIDLSDLRTNQTEQTIEDKEDNNNG